MAGTCGRCHGIDGVLDLKTFDLENPAPGAINHLVGGAPCAVKLVVEVLNRTPNKDAFCFERIDNGLRRAGAYRLEYVMLPDLPGKGPLTLTTEITVAPGPLAQLHVQVLLDCHAHAMDSMRHTGQYILSLLCR